MYYPIWKDYVITLANSAVLGGVQFRIQLDGTVIYNGRAFARPGETNIKVRINDICAEYFAGYWDGLANGVFPIKKTFVVSVMTDNGWQTADTITFRPDWSYDANNTGAYGTITNVPITKQFIPGQLWPVSFVNIASFTYTIHNGINDFNNDFNNDFAILGDTTVPIIVPTGGSYWWIDIPATAQWIEVNGTKYYADKNCRQYALYYINAYGYWDTLVVQANTAESDAVKRLTNERTYDNRQHYNRGKWNYANELTHRYSFNTAWLAEDQSLLMHHLLNSPLVYLHDVTKNEIHPIVLVDTSTEYKRDGKGLYQYSFVAELAQERVRR